MYMKYRNSGNIVQLILTKVGGTRIFSISFEDSRSVGIGGLFRIRALINNVNSQGLACFNSILSYISSKVKYIYETHKIGQT
jgi:hypothetical protein